MNIFQKKSLEQVKKNQEAAKKEAALSKTITSITGVKPSEANKYFRYKMKTYTIGVVTSWRSSTDKKKVYEWYVTNNADEEASHIKVGGHKIRMAMGKHTPLDYDKLYAELRAELKKKA